MTLRTSLSESLKEKNKQHGSTTYSPMVISTYAALKYILNILHPSITPPIPLREMRFKADWHPEHVSFLPFKQKCKKTKIQNKTNKKKPRKKRKTMYYWIFTTKKHFFKKKYE